MCVYINPHTQISNQIKYTVYIYIYIRSHICTYLRTYVHIRRLQNEHGYAVKVNDVGLEFSGNWKVMPGVSVLNV